MESDEDETDLDYFFSDSDNLIWLPEPPVMKSDLVDIPGKVDIETPLAYRFYDGRNEAVWLPKSQCEWDAGTQTMTMPEWLALDKGLI
jgi:hypothetical protein